MRSRACLRAARSPKRVTVSLPGDLPVHFIQDLKDLVHHHRGDYELMLRVGERSLLLGPDFRVSDSTSFRTELEELTGVRAAA